MRKALLLVLLLTSFIFDTSYSQDTLIADDQISQLKIYEEQLKVLGHTVLTDSIKENRVKANTDLKKLLKEALAVKNSFHYPFDSLTMISKVYPQDSTFRMFTWQLYVDKDDYKYGGGIQMNSEDLQFHVLEDRSSEMEEIDYEDLTADYWYGALYYNLKAFDSPEGTKYLLFGFDGFQFFTKKKLVDVLSFQEGKPIFGAPVFGEKEDNGGIGIGKNRLVFEYAAETSIRLNYDEQLSMVIHDNMISMMTRRGPVLVPDGSYVGYKLKNGKWAYVDKIFNQVSDEAPRPQPILNETDRSKRKDLFGNK